MVSVGLRCTYRFLDDLRHVYKVALKPFKQTHKLSKATSKLLKSTYKFSKLSDYLQPNCDARRAPQCGCKYINYLESLEADSGVP